MKKEVIAYLHSHWDREWYREFELFRMRLLRVFDNVLDQLEKDAIPSFYFDGQTSALLDYLEIRPQKKDIIRQFIKEKRLYIGPFYCLVDEFLTDEECFRKNLEFGLNTAREFGCEEFVGYFADTFGHSASTIPILKDYGIDTAMVWRGCGEVPSEFTWEFEGSKINTINLVRGYFNDVFSTGWDIGKKTEFLKTNLDKISEQSGDTLILPIGADHLGLENDIQAQIDEVNKNLDDYEIHLGSIFEYIEKVGQRFELFKVEGELRDNSKTFILEGSYTSRPDIKRYNTESCYRLDIANRLVKYFKSEQEYSTLIDYAYKLLLQNQAHDSICGCSTDDVHSENITRYKKILQIANNIVEELRFKSGYKLDRLINLSDRDYEGTIEFSSELKYDDRFQVISKEKGFPQKLYLDPYRIPVTEDYTDIYKYCVYTTAKSNTLAPLEPKEVESDVFVTDSCIGNSHIFLSVQNGEMFVGDTQIKFVDYQDEGDSYNTGYVENDNGTVGEILSTKILTQSQTRSTLGIEVKVKDDILHLKVSLDKNSKYLKFELAWQNTMINHLLEFVADTKKPITTTLSEDFDNIIERRFEPNYDVRKNLPKEKGKEVKPNTAPMRRGVKTNGVSVVTKGLNQYEIYKTELHIPILRSVGVISNPENPSRTTPAGPPIEVHDLKMLNLNRAEFYMFLDSELRSDINTIYNKCVVI